MTTPDGGETPPDGATTATTEPAGHQAPQGKPDATETDAKDDLGDDLEKWKSLARKNEERAKANADAAKRLKEIEDANKSDLEKLTDDRDGHKTRADQAEAENAKLRAAIKHGLTDDDLELLGTGTADEIEARAERLAARLSTNRRPAPDPAQGKTPTSKEDPDAWLRAAAGR